MRATPARTLLIQLMALALSLGSVAHAADGKAGPGCLAIANQVVEQLLPPSNKFTLDPEVLLKSKGLDPNLVRFNFSSSLVSKKGTVLGTLKVFYGDKPALEIFYTSEPSGKRVIPLTFAITEPELINKGLGTLAYLAGAKLLHERHNLLLSSDKLGDYETTNVSDSARALWERLRAEGLAELDSCPFAPCYKLKTETVQGTKLDRVAAFVATHSGTPETSGASKIREGLANGAKDRDFNVYSQQMDASMAENLKVITPWLPSKFRPVIVDVGMGTGALSNTLATTLPESHVIGVDLAPEMVARAQQNYQRPNLNFVQSSANQPFANQADAAIYSSITHEIYSYSGDSNETLAGAFKTAHDSLAPGGRIIIRDFVRPENGDKPVLMVHKKSDITAGQSFADFARDFNRPIRMKKVSETAESITYETDMASAYEYMFRKDFHQNWKVELKEKYGFWTSRQAKTLLEQQGFNVIHSQEIRNPWIEEKRLKGKISLLDPTTREPIDYPNYQIVIVGEKGMH